MDQIPLALVLACGLIGVAVLFANLRIFHVSSTLDEVLIELKLLRLLSFKNDGLITEEDFVKKARSLLENK